MLLANSTDGTRIRAARVPATCPGCGKPVVSKIGYLNTSHWAHQAHSDCTYGVGMTEWHLSWQSIFKDQYLEITVGPHRADILIPEEQLVIEFQHSGISAEEAEERTAYWNDQGYRVAWFLDASKRRIEHRSSWRYDGKLWDSFRWYNYRKGWDFLKGYRANLLLHRTNELILNCDMSADDYFKSFRTIKARVVSPNSFVRKLSPYLLDPAGSAPLVYPTPQ